MTPDQSFSDVPFDADRLFDRVTTNDRAETYRTVLSNAVTVQSDALDSDEWGSYLQGFSPEDVQAVGWELGQLQRLGVVDKGISTGSGTKWRLGHRDDEDWTHHHEAVDALLQMAEDRGDGPPASAEVAGGSSPGLEAADPNEMFTDVVGYEQEKKWFRRTLSNEADVHHMLTGAPGSGKSMILDSILEHVPDARRVVYTGNQSTAQGVVEVLKQDRPSVLVVEEVEKGSKKDREALMTLTGQGYIQETKADGRSGETIELDTVVFAAGNDRSLITPPSLVDRFLTWEFTQYTREEFVEVCEGVLPRDYGISGRLARVIAASLYDETGSTSVRDASDIAELAETEEEVAELASLVA